MTQYQLNDINTYLWDMTTANVQLDWNDSKYVTLLNFLKTHEGHANPPTCKKSNTFSRTGENGGNLSGKSIMIDRSSFGNRVEKKIVLFGECDNLDDIIKCKINELSSKITEKNVDQIMEEFQTIKFGEADDLSKISKCLHRAILVSSNYGDQIISLLNFLIKTYPQYKSELQKQFLNYAESQFHILSGLDETDLDNLESMFILKKDIMTNYQLIIMNSTKGTLFEQSIVSDIIDFLFKSGKLNGIEILIKFLVYLKSQKLPFPITLIDTISSLIKSEKYPKRLDFLLMDLEP